MPNNVNFNDPFFDEITKYPVHFATPVIMGNAASMFAPKFLRNGTATLVLLDGRFLAVTCHHVVQFYRDLASDVAERYFQIGEVRLDPEPLIVDEDKEVDLAVLDVSTFVSDNLLPRRKFLEPVNWPPSKVAEDDVLALAGFPGIWREALERRVLRFYSMSVGAGAVASISETHIATRFDLANCIVQINSGKVWGSMGGMSGGPVYVWRKSFILTAELVGFVYEYHEQFDILRVRRARMIRSDGTIDR